MTFRLDQRIAELLALGAGPSTLRDFREGDAGHLRRMLDDGLAQLSALPAVEGVSVRRYAVSTEDGHLLRMTWYAKPDESPGAAVLHFHGGAMIAGSVDLYDPLLRTYVGWTSVPMLSVDYRLAPEVPAGTAAKDGLTALRWLLDHAASLGVAPERIAVMGDSGGGGVAAGVAILARDHGIPLAKQVLVYPMLDDRTAEPDPHLDSVPQVFPYAYNRTAWAAVLAGRPDTPPAAVPGRNTDFAGLAPAFIEVGELDIFRDESVRYAQGLWAAGVSAELHVHPGQPHAYDVLLLDESHYQEGKIRVLRDL